MEVEQVLPDDSNYSFLNQHAWEDALLMQEMAWLTRGCMERSCRSITTATLPVPFESNYAVTNSTTLCRHECLSLFARISYCYTCTSASRGDFLSHSLLHGTLLICKPQIELALPMQQRNPVLCVGCPLRS